MHSLVVQISRVVSGRGGIVFQSPPPPLLLFSLSSRALPWRVMYSVAAAGLGRAEGLQSRETGGPGKLGAKHQFEKKWICTRTFYV